MANITPTILTRLKKLIAKRHDDFIVLATLFAVSGDPLVSQYYQGAANALAELEQLIQESISEPS